MPSFFFESGVYLKTNLGVFSVALFGVIFIRSITEAIAADKRITKKEVPPAVLKAFSDSYPKAIVNGFGKETEHGKMYYELETVDGTLKRDLLYKADGTVAEIEETLTPQSIPETIDSAILKEMPKAIIIRGEKTISGGLVSFEVVVTSGKEKVRIVLNADGEIKSRSILRSERKETR